MVVETGTGRSHRSHWRRKALGQHFLHDAATVRDILAAAELRPGQSVLEVGPGPGVLTDPLCQAVQPGGRVVGVEADHALAAALKAKGLPGLDVVEGDAVRVDLAAMGRFDRIVSNLPYSISGPITAAFLGLLRQPERRWGLAVLMYQREFAERLLASPGTGDYGRLTVQCARWCSVEKVRAVPPGAFQPPPQVDSLVVRLRPHARPPFEVRDEELWSAVVDGSFQGRRKQLRNTVPGAAARIGLPKERAREVVETLGWGSRRPEELAPSDFAHLVGRLAEVR